MPRRPTIARPLAAVLRTWGSVTVTLSLLVTGASAAGPKPDEEVVLFPTVGRYDRAANQWVVPIRGCIFEPERDSTKRRILLSLLASRLDLDSDASPLFREYAAAFLVDNERARVLEIEARGRRVTCEPSGPNGQFTGELRLDAGKGDVPPPDHDVTLHLVVCTRDHDERVFAADVQLLAEHGVSVISDIDDTVKLSAVRDTREMLRNTFLRPYRAVEGMPRLLTALRDAGASIHYVSASPWQLLAPLQKMFAAEGLPAGSFHLKTLRWKDETLFDLFAKSGQYKLAALESLLREHPGRRFILVGDSGEQDPEIYARLAREHPAQVAAILIRIVDPAHWPAERAGAVFNGIPCAAVTFTDPAQLDAAGVFKLAEAPPPAAR